MPQVRTLVFISHANPEDNEFTLWLASRLTSMGYLVWSDLTRLIGAEVFWDDIEEAIRDHAAKVLIVLSRKSQQKEGVLNEIAVATAVEKNQKVKHFTVPIRIDDLPHGDIRSALIRKNVIEAGENWADGLRSIVKVLERDDVPKSQTLSARESGDWIQKIVSGPSNLRNDAEVLLSNQFEVEKLPDTLNFFRAPVDKEDVSKTISSPTCTVYPYRQMIASFAGRDDIQGLLPKWKAVTDGPKIPLPSILNGAPHPLPDLEWREASNIVSFLFRSAWDKKMESIGLHQYDLANGRIAWFPGKGGYGDDWIRFRDLGGGEKKRKLIGFSQKYKAYWHFGMDIRPIIGRTVRLVLIPHVVFTQDGKTPLPSPERMHRLRRGFCKLWWNNRWRDLILGYIELLKGGSESIHLEVGSDQEILIEGFPCRFESPVSFDVLSDSSGEEDFTDSQLDEMADECDPEPVDNGDGEEEEDYFEDE